jgi:hypothetical protein
MVQIAPPTQPAVAPEDKETVFRAKKEIQRTFYSPRGLTGIPKSHTYGSP